jgi:hypothetical protein
MKYFEFDLTAVTAVTAKVTAVKGTILQKVLRGISIWRERKKVGSVLSVPNTLTDIGI